MTIPFRAVALVALVSGCTTSHPPSEPLPASGADDDDATAEEGSEGDDNLAFVSGTPTEHGTLLAEANRIVASTKRSSYSHKTHIDEATGRFEVDCSGLVDYALSRVAPDALRAIGVKRPLAKHYVAFLAGLPTAATKDRWRRVDRASDLVPGDVIAWRKPADVVTNNTGHIMIVRAPITIGHGEIAVPIIDATSVRHGADDSRYATKATGVGTGTIHLVVNDASAPTGYRWSNGKKAKNHATAISLGRID